MRRNKVFRIESQYGMPEPAYMPDMPVMDDYRADERHREIMAELANLQKSLAATNKPQKASAPQDIGKEMMANLRAEFSEAAKLKTELDAMYEAIKDTKREIASLHHSGFQGKEMSRVTDELDAIVTGTEQATESILSAAETIDDDANTLSAKLTGDDQGVASDIRERTVEIFEACNFQDLTGQRITKVVNTLRFIEDRIVSMMEIWGGLEAFKSMDLHEFAEAEGDAALLNGPALNSDADVASQDDIDALFD